MLVFDVYNIAIPPAEIFVGQRLINLDMFTMPFFRKDRSPKAAKGKHHYDVPSVSSSYVDLRVELSYLLDQVNAVQEKLDRVQGADLKPFSISHDFQRSRTTSSSGPSAADSTTPHSLSSQDSPPPISEIYVHAAVGSPRHSFRNAVHSQVTGNQEMGQSQSKNLQIPTSTTHCPRSQPPAAKKQEAASTMVSGGSASSSGKESFTGKSKQRKYRLVKRLDPVREDVESSATMRVTPPRTLVPTTIAILPSPKTYPDECPPVSPPSAFVTHMRSGTLELEDVVNGSAETQFKNSSSSSLDISKMRSAPNYFQLPLNTTSQMGEGSHQRHTRTKPSVSSAKREHMKHGNGAKNAALLAQIRTHDLELKPVDIVSPEGKTIKDKASTPAGGLIAAIQAGVALKHVTAPSRRETSPTTHTSALLAKLQQRKKECQRRAENKMYQTDDW
eukprot:Nitzschia sp. Nitz4//scaffold3_size479765//427135//428531//NITZ4_000181-RA/size479765-augustus-gene-1.585-mRNA-1//1//CDS//3329551001//4748//frame0